MQPLHLTRRALGRGVTGSLIATALGAGMATPGHAEERISPAEAHAIGTQAYVYLYSPVTMERTRRQLTNVERPVGLAAPMNMFRSLGAYRRRTTGRWCGRTSTRCIRVRGSI